MIATYQSGPYTTVDNNGDLVVRALTEVYCLSTDTKPTDHIANGSVCVEIDTGTVFLFDEEGGDWVEQFSLQDGSGAQLNSVSLAAQFDRLDRDIDTEDEPEEE